MLSCSHVVFVYALQVAEQRGKTEILTVAAGYRTTQKVVRESLWHIQRIPSAAAGFLVTAALIATFSFTAFTAPPELDDAPDGYLAAFLVCSALAFYFSIGTLIFSTYLAFPMRYEYQGNNKRFLAIAAMLLVGSICCALAAFMVATIMAFHDKLPHISEAVVYAPMALGLCIAFGSMFVIGWTIDQNMHSRGFSFQSRPWPASANTSNSLSPLPTESQSIEVEN